ncbi:MAG: hypothetical protein O3A01_01445 [bacterium]|nr:hypothetical protein [bacterium]
MPYILLFIFSIFVLMTGCDQAKSNTQTVSKPVQIARYDSGTSTVDVSAYQVRVRWWYHRFFSSKCSKCHTAARPLNAPYRSKEDWAEIIARMASKEGASMTEEEAKSIEKFLIYDAKKRKSGE